MRGRKPTPTALKVLRGNPGKRPLNKDEPVPPKGMPKMPAWLSSAAKKFWKGSAKEFYKAGLLTKFDVVAFAAMCEQLGTIEQCNKMLAEHGMTMIGQSGFPVKHPAVSIKREYVALLRSFASEFGLTPSSRSRVKIAREEGENPLLALLNKAKSS